MAKRKTANAAGLKSIFVTVGTHPQQFDRLLSEIGRLIAAGKISAKVLCQGGHSTYNAKEYKIQNFMDLDEFEKAVRAADIVVTHAGEGNVGLCKNLGKKMVVVPRRSEFGEHTNDHQLELAAVVEEKGLGLVAWNPNELEEKLAQIEKFAPARIPRGKINEMLESYVKGELGW